MGDLKTLGKYTIQSVLGQGAMGIVYKGFDPGIERTVAIKAIRKDAFNPTEMDAILERFKREAQAAGRLTHPGIVTVYEYAEEGDNAFIAMEYVEGRELQDFLDSKERFPLNTAIDITIQLLDVLNYSHAQGVVHRDIKPANIIMFGDGLIKVMDFGIAKIESSNLTQFGDVFGTPAYMSPEQFAGQPVDGRTDLYSAGVLLYNLLTGENPFPGESVTNIMHQVMNAEAPVASGINLQVPGSLDEIVRKALAKDPGKRYQTAEEFKAELTEKSLVDETLSADLSGKTNPELREICAAAGITGISKQNKKQLIATLKDAGDDTTKILKANLTLDTTQPVDQAVAGDADQPKEYDKTLFEPQGDQGEEVKRTPFIKKLKRAMAILLVTIIAISGFTGWKIYKGDLTFQEVKQTVIMAKDDPASSFKQLSIIAKDKTIDISILVYGQLKELISKKSEDTPKSSPDKNKSKK